MAVVHPAYRNLLPAIKDLGRTGRWQRPFMALLGAFQVLLARYSGGEEDVAVGSPIAGSDPLRDGRSDRLFRQHDRLSAAT